MEDPAYRKLMDYAMRSLGRRAHTTSELRDKLKKKPLHSANLENAIITRLGELDLLNDEKFTRNLIEDAVNYKFHGRMKVGQKLHRKGIPFKEMNRIWNEMEINEKEVAQSALARAEKRFKSLQKEKLYQKRAQFLAARGFSPEIVFELAKSQARE